MVIAGNSILPELLFTAFVPFTCVKIVDLGILYANAALSNVKVPLCTACSVSFS